MVKNYSPCKKLRIALVKQLFACFLFTFTLMSYAQTSDLSITKEVNDASPNVNDQITFTITISNAGPDVANGVTVRDVLPTGYGGITNISGGGSTSGTTVLWPGLTIPVTNSPGDEIVLTLTTTVLPSGDYNNRAEIIASNSSDPDSDVSLSFDTDDGLDGTPDLIDDDETEEVVVTPMRADLSLTKSVDNPNSLFGDEVTFTLLLNNAGPDIATGVRVQDILPSGYGGITSISGGGSTLGNNVNWSGLTVNPGQTVALTISATVLPTGDYDNRAEIVASDVYDPDSDPSKSFDEDDGKDGTPDLIDDDETPFVEVSPLVADLSITKEVELLDLNLINGRPHQGTNVVFTITVTNNGPDDTQNVVVEDQLPAGFIYVSDDGFGDYDQASGIWTVGDLSSGASESLSITAVIGLEDDYTNVAQITNSDSFDPDATNNQDSVTIDPVDVFIPQAFSPDGDNVNDTFEIPGLGFLYPNFKIEIFTRWGNKVYDYENNGSTSPQWWDGFSNGNLNFNGSERVPSGTYYYILYFNQDNIAPISNWVYVNRIKN